MDGSAHTVGSNPMRTASRIGMLVVAWGAVAAVGAFVLLRVLGVVDRHATLFALATLTVWLLVPLLGALVVAAVLRARALAAISGLLLAVVGAWVAPDLRWWSTAAAVEGPTFVVAATNVGPDHRAIEDMAADVMAIEADVLNIVELTEADRRALNAAGLRQRYPYAIEDPQTGAHGSGIYSRYPLRDAEVLRITAAPMAKATVELPTGPVTIVAVHTTQPLAALGLLERQFEQLRDVVAEIDGPVVLAGDFNVTRQHKPFRELLDAGFTDAHLATGRGRAATWPVGRRLVPPFALIDHVLVSPQLTVASVKEVTVSGSDHRGVVATVGPSAR